MRINLPSLAKFLTTAAALAAVHTVVGEKAAAVVALLAGLLASQNDPIVHTTPAAPAAPAADTSATPTAETPT